MAVESRVSGVIASPTAAGRDNPPNPLLAWIAASAFGLLAMTDGYAASLPRVASTSLCTDQFLLGLAAPDQIVSVSWQATGPLSLHADRAGGYPQNRGEAEELLYLDVDMVLMPGWRAGSTGPLLERFGVTVIDVPLANSFDEIRQITLEVGEAIGRPEAAQAAIAAMDARLAEAAERSDDGPRSLAAYYTPGGGSAGTGTFVDAAMQAAGLRNLKAELGQAGWGALTLEDVVTHQPEVIVTSFFDTAGTGRRTAFARHPLVGRLMADAELVAVPGSTWVCGGWFLAEAVEHLMNAGADRAAPITAEP